MYNEGMLKDRKIKKAFIKTLNMNKIKRLPSLHPELEKMQEKL
jgi:hypothetical protein